MFLFFLPYFGLHHHIYRTKYVYRHRSYHLPLSSLLPTPKNYNQFNIVVATMLLQESTLCGRNIGVVTHISILDALNEVSQNGLTWLSRYILDLGLNIMTWAC